MKQWQNIFLLPFLMFITALSANQSQAQQISMHDSARAMLTYFEDHTKDKKLKATLREAASSYTGDSITDSLASKLLGVENALRQAKKINPKKLIPYASLLVRLFKTLEPAEAHLAYAGSLNGLASLYENAGEYQKAQPLYEKALDVTRKTYGDQHPAYANSMNNLAFLYQTMGDYGRALHMFQRVSTILKNVLGENNDAYITSLNRQAAVYELMGDVGTSRYLYQRAMSIKQKR